MTKGELRPELANLLCLISEPQKTDTFLDPFCGFGAIPIERAKNFPFGKVIASDIDLNNINLLKEKTKQKIQIENWDALNLKEIEDSSIHKIVTDPPWGVYKQEGIDLISFYLKMLKEFYRILKPNGLLVLLTGRKLEIEKIINSSASLFLLEKKYNILVSGKKANVYKFRKLK